MGTTISLYLNGVPIDHGKNRTWTNHHWLFPPNSLKNMTYEYADNISATKLGFETKLKHARFRLNHMGYSATECQSKFEKVVERWSRTGHFTMTYEDFHRIITSIDFKSSESWDWEHRIFGLDHLLAELCSDWEGDGVIMEEFVIEEFETPLILRVLAERPENLDLSLQWQHSDLVENGWASMQDIYDIDVDEFRTNHTILFGRLQEFSGSFSIKGFDNWLENQGLKKIKTYHRLAKNGDVIVESLTLPTFVRNVIHHPENELNMFHGQELRDSLEQLLSLAQFLPTR